MTTVSTLTADAVVQINKLVCDDGGNRHQCYDVGKVESALHSAFYPENYPFQHGGVARLAGALCYYLTQAHAFFDGNKRTALLSALTFLDLNGLDLTYPTDDSGKTAAAALIERCASGGVTKDEMMEWFDQHKTRA
jgi:death-on-curing protein